MTPIFYPRAQRAIDNGSRSPDDLTGYLPMFISESSSMSAVEQLNYHYSHGGGWHDFEGFTLHDGDEPKLLYPGDPPTLAVCQWKLRDERIILFDHAWVAVVQPDGSYRISRMD